MTYNEEAHIESRRELLKKLQDENLELQIQFEQDEVAALEGEIDRLDRCNVDLKIRIEDEQNVKILTREDLMRQLRLALHREDSMKRTIRTLSTRLSSVESKVNGS